MKSLQESLFDTDLDKKEIETFGSVYVPYNIEVWIDDYMIDEIFNKFSLSKLKRAAKPYDISKIKGSDKLKQLSNTAYNVLPYIIGIADTMLLEEGTFDEWRSKSRMYQSIFDEVFSKFILSKYKYRKGVGINVSSYTDTDDIDIFVGNNGDGNRPYGYVKVEYKKIRNQ